MSRRFKLFEAPARSNEHRLAVTVMAGVHSEEEAGRLHVLRNENKMRTFIMQSKEKEEKYLVTPSPLSSSGSSECFNMSGYHDPEDCSPTHGAQDEGLDLDLELEASPREAQYQVPVKRRYCSFDDEESSYEEEHQAMEEVDDSMEDFDTYDSPLRALDEDSSEYLKEVNTDVQLLANEQLVRIPWLGREDDCEEPEGQCLDVSAATWLRLYPHQREGVAWLWKQSCEVMSGRPGGGIMADEMGLGKTVQLLAFLEATLMNGYGKRVLIAVPPTVISSWQTHQETWCPKLRLVTLLAETPGALRSTIIDAFKSESASPLVMLTTYGMVKSLNKRGKLLDDIAWDYVVLDEGHIIKNTSTQLAIAAKALQSKVRFILTGTPVQNSLDEFWSLFTFVDTRVLGSNGAAFKRTFTEPIRKGMLRNATDSAKKTAQEVAEKLRTLYSPFVIQRKKDVMDALVEPPPKVDMVVWCSMTDLQKKVYTDYIEGNEVKECIQKKENRGAICMLTNLRKLCNHLWLQQPREGLATWLQTPNEKTEDYGSILKDCGKMEVLCKIYEKSREEGHRLLIFSQSVKMLHIIATVLQHVFPDAKLLQLDGSTKHRDRQVRVDEFNNDTSIDAMLLSTGVGGVGLTLTGASRVVIFDPDWNPAKDSQAIGRAHRIGQKEQVVVYRLMTCGGVEEFTYRQEIFKECIERKTTKKTSILRYFTPIELHAMFNFEPDAKKTLVQLTSLQGACVYPPAVSCVTSELLKLPGVNGITDHDAVFTFTDPTDDDLASPRSILASPRACLSEIQANKTPQLETVKQSRNSYDFIITSPERRTSVSTCSDPPRDEDDKDMLRSAEEAFTRHQSCTPRRPLGLPPRHSSKSPVIKADKCPSCDFSMFPFCPVTGRPHRKPDSAERSDRSDSESSRVTGCSPPLNPHRIEAKLLALAEESTDDLMDRDVSMGGTASEGSARSTSVPAPPLKLREGCHFSVGTAQRELSFGSSAFHEREMSMSGTSFCTAPCDSTRSLSVPGAPCRAREGLGVCFETAQRLSFGSFASNERDASMGGTSFGTAACESIRSTSVPGAPIRVREGCNFSSGSVQREMSFGSVVNTERELSLGGASFCTAPCDSARSLSVPGAPCRMRENVALSVAAAQRELSYASSCSRSASGDSAPGAPVRHYQRESFSSCVTARGLSFGAVSECGKASPSPNRLHFGRETFSSESMGTCCSSSSPCTMVRNETPQGCVEGRYSVPGAPLRPNRSGSGNSTFSANSGNFKGNVCCERLSMSSNFVSPAPHHLHAGIRRRPFGARCSESTAASDIDDIDLLSIPARSVSGSTDDSLFIHHASMTTPPPF